MRLVAALLVVLALAGAVVAYAAGGSEGEDSEQPIGVGPVRAGSVASLADCEDWNEGGEEARLATIEDIHNQLNQVGSVGPTPDLPVDEAYALFERSCEPTYAAGFRLYKLYARASAFGLYDGP